MSGGVHLVGGGWGGDARVWRAFVAEAAARPSGPPRIAVVSVRDDDEQEHAAKLVAAVQAAGRFEPIVVAVREGSASLPARSPRACTVGAPDGHPIVDEEAAEDLEGITVEEGLGLVPSSADVHAAQRGTLARLVAALVAEGVVIDEDTDVLVRGSGTEVVGTGNVWVHPAGSRVRVRREPATR